MTADFSMICQAANRKYPTLKEGIEAIRAVARSVPLCDRQNVMNDVTRRTLRIGNQDSTFFDDFNNAGIIFLRWCLWEELDDAKEKTTVLERWTNTSLHKMQGPEIRRMREHIVNMTISRVPLLLSFPEVHWHLIAQRMSEWLPLESDRFAAINWSAAPGHNTGRMSTHCPQLATWLESIVPREEWTAAALKNAAQAYYAASTPLEIPLPCLESVSP